MLAQVAFIVWRESVEAFLVIGILASWIAGNPAAAPARRYLWAGVAAGIVLSAVLAFAIVRFAEVLPPEAQDWFQVALVLLAAGLIVQMVVWMRRHGRTLKRELQGGLDTAADQQKWIGVFLLAMIAVAREGSEAVIFLYGTLASAQTGIGAAIFSAVLGFGLALLTYALLQMGRFVMSWRSFFRLTEAMLLLLGCGLFTSGVGQLVSLGVLPFTETLWDTSWILDDMSRFGGLVASLTGYRAEPDVVTLASWIVYWVGVTLLLRPPRPVVTGGAV